MSTATASELRDRLKLKYVGDCKCGNCQLVEAGLIVRAATQIEQLCEHVATLQKQLRV